MFCFPCLPAFQNSFVGEGGVENEQASAWADAHGSISSGQTLRSFGVLANAALNRVMTVSEDEFDTLEFPELTKDDLSSIDALSSACLPAVSVAFEEPITSQPPAVHVVSPSAESPEMQMSLHSLFRSRMLLSVTDLTAPVWCELKFEYGLRGKRWLPPSRRPDVVVTKTGKEIKVRKDVAKAADATMRRGRYVILRTFP